MINLKKTRKDHQCGSMRCMSPPAKVENNPHHLCARHFEEWQAAGSPELTTAAEKPTKTEATGIVKADRAALVTELDTIRARMAPVLQQMSTVELNTPEAIAWLGEAREGARQAHAWLDAKRKTENEPYLAAKREVDDLFKPILETSKAMIDIAASRLAQLEAGRLMAQQAALAAVDMGSHDPNTITVAQAAPVLPPQVRAVDEWDYEIVDFAQVPEYLKMVDRDKVMRLVRHHGGAVTIPGLTITRTVRVVTNSAHARGQDAPEA